MYRAKIRAAMETILNNNLLDDWNVSLTDERAAYSKGQLEILVEFECVYFINPKGDSYKIDNPFFMSDFKNTLELFTKN